MAGLGPSAPAQPTSGANWDGSEDEDAQYFNLFREENINGPTRFERPDQVGLRATSAEAVPAAAGCGGWLSIVTLLARPLRARRGSCAASVKVIEGPSYQWQTLTGETRKRLFAGPERKKGYYGYFLEHGWKHPIGPRTTYTTKRGDRWKTGGSTYTTGRAQTIHRRRYAASQMGTTQSKQIPAARGLRHRNGPPTPRATAAAEAAFEAKMKELDSRA